MALENSSEKGRSSTSKRRRFIELLVFILIPTILLIAIGWTAYRVIGAFTERVALEDQINQRQVYYAETATAIAPASDNQSNADSEIVLVAQVFATNTPDEAHQDTNQTTPEPPDNTENEVFATSTPEPPIPTVANQSGADVTPTLVPLPTLIFSSDPTAQELSGTAVPAEVPTIPRNHNLVNILLLGGDDEVTQDNFQRTDSMIVVSVNMDTRTVSMLSLPRDLFVYIPSGTMQRLNTAYGIGEAIGWTDGGFGLLRQTILYNLGINVHYYARVNFSGFEEIIDTLGGIEVAVDCAYQDYYPVDDVDPNRSLEENYYLRTLPVGYYEMDGFDALWYARTRRTSDDFDRGRRQQQILRAVFGKAIDSGQLAQLPSLWGQLTEVVETDLPLQKALELLPIGLGLETNEIENFTLIRWYHTTPWQPPDGQYVQLPEYEPIRNLLIDFYTPPTQNQATVNGATIAVFNGTDNENLDRVATESLRWDGFNAIAYGLAESNDYPDTVLIDKVGQEKGSLVPLIVGALDISPENVIPDPDPNRETDYEIYLGANYDSCDAAVLDIES